MRGRGQLGERRRKLPACGQERGLCPPVRPHRGDLEAADLRVGVEPDLADVHAGGHAVTGEEGPLVSPPPNSAWRPAILLPAQAPRKRAR